MFLIQILLREGKRGDDLVLSIDISQAVEKIIKENLAKVKKLANPI